MIKQKANNDWIFFVLLLCPFFVTSGWAVNVQCYKRLFTVTNPADPNYMKQYVLYTVRDQTSTSYYFDHYAVSHPDNGDLTIPDYLRDLATLQVQDEGSEIQLQFPRSPLHGIDQLTVINFWTLRPNISESFYRQATRGQNFALPDIPYTLIGNGWSIQSHVADDEHFTFELTNTIGAHRVTLGSTSESPTFSTPHNIEISGTLPEPDTDSLQYYSLGTARELSSGDRALLMSLIQDRSDRCERFMQEQQEGLRREQREGYLHERPEGALDLNDQIGMLMEPEPVTLEQSVDGNPQNRTGQGTSQPRPLEYVQGLQHLNGAIVDKPSSSRQ